MRPLEWVVLILNRHGLDKPDGRQLFQYRLTDKEFANLTDLLKTSAYLGITNIAKVPFWNSAFVIYASEWWRRQYAGQWGWDGIFKSLGIDYNELTIGKRNDLIEMGLHRWRRDVRVHNGSRKFLGTVATEGGLPLHQLADSGGWLRGVLQPVLKKHVSRDIAIPVLIENYSDLIPSAYRSPETAQILADIAETVISLRKEHELMNKESPLDWLDSNRPNWRELFPLPIDDAAGKSLLSDLVDAASKARADEAKKNPFEVERFLIRAESAVPELIAQIEMPTFVYFDSLEADISDINFPSSFNLEISEPNGDVWPWCRGILTTTRGKQALKLSGRTLKLSGVDATKELRLRFKAMGETVLEINLSNGNLLDPELPWLFRSIDEKWALHGVASQSIESEFAMVFIPPDYLYEALDDDTPVYEYGSLLSGRILKISGAIRCFSEDVKYKISAGMEESVVQYHLSGNRFSYGIIPSEIFLGLPRLIEKNSITGFSSVNRGDRLLAKPVGVNTQWRPLAQDSVGYYEVRMLDANGDIQLRKRIGILDENFKFKIKPDDRQVNMGSIRLSCVGDALISVCSKDVLAHVEKSSGTVDIQLTAEKSPPICVGVNVLPNGHKRELLLTLPFPSSGALLFDAEGEQVSFSAQLFMNNLMGYRVKAYIDQFIQDQSADLIFSLIDPDVPNKSLKDMYIKRRIILRGEVSEFSLYDWLPFIDSLMSVSTSLGAMVKVSLINRGKDIFGFVVHRYENEMAANYDEGVIEIESEMLRNMKSEVLENAMVSAFSLNQPEQADVLLEPLASESALVGKWQFFPEKVKPGPWLIYPLEKSHLQFRPLLWNVGLLVEFDPDSISEIDTLPKAINVPDKKQRNVAIRQVLQAMSVNFKHKSWGYLTNLWEKSSHLTMSTFDVWRIAVSETGFLASLLIIGNNDIVEKLENELPLIWELVMLEDWENALNLYSEKIKESLGDDELVFELIRKKIQTVESLSASMVSMGEILRFKMLDEPSPVLNAMRSPVAAFLGPQLNIAQQDLLRRQAENSWPEILSSHIYHTMRSLPESYNHLLEVHHDHHKSVIYLPLILAWRSVSSDNSDWPGSTVELFKIQQLKEFDEDWFSTAFQFLSGWLSQQDNLGIH